MKDVPPSSSRSSRSPGRRRRGWRIVLRVLLAVVVLLAAGAATLWIAAREALGSRPVGARLSRIERSPQWRDGAFRNRLPRVDGPGGRMVTEFFFGGCA